MRGPFTGNVLYTCSTIQTPHCPGVTSIQPPTKADVQRALAASFLADVDAQTARAVTETGTLHLVRAGEIFIGQAETHRCGIIVNGLARVFLSLTDGREKTVREVTMGAAVGVAALTGIPNPVSVQAVVESHVLDLDPRALIARAERVPSLAMAIAREVTHRLHDTYRVMAVEFGNVRQRLARLLIDLAAGRPEEPAIVTASHPELAARLGCSREWVTRTLAAFRRDGLVATERDRILLLDPMRLHVVANAWRTIPGVEDERHFPSLSEQDHRRQ